MGQFRRFSAGPSWLPLIVTLPHPDYPSGHCLGAGAVLRFLQATRGDDKFSMSFVYLSLGALRSDGCNERGGAAALSGTSDDTSLGYARLGLRAATTTRL